jgi:HAD superfamily hydrolase (TIGR01484 family)
MDAWIFDVDGVITNSISRKVENTQLVDKLSEMLKKGERIAFITGRTSAWVESNATSFFPKDLLNMIFVSSEFSAVIVFHENGEQIKSVNKEAIIPEEIKKKAMKIAEEYKDFIAHEEKEVILSFRMTKGVNFTQFKKCQKELVDKLETLVKDSKIDDKFEVQFDRIGTNIRRIGIDKYFAVATFLNWLGKKGIHPNNFTVFGDSHSDLEMGKELLVQNKKFTFVYVGEDLDKKNSDFPIIKTVKHYDEGTLEYLESGTV